ncbi:NUDIX domain-containing protein [Kineococcus sp. R8]|uniref:NUDIX domain-containing protein n=1 Tax=Kineococcus siccus TaxID=2696567 RepID=UPI00141290A4|nr:NUDIX domain-containing protein [Kineococcus siccus]
MPEYARRSARVLLVDGGERLLLLRTLVRPGEPSAGHVWLTPGGGVEDGESAPRAAARELREEVGLTVTADDLTWVASTSGHADLGWIEGFFRDDFFVHRVHLHTVDTAGLEEVERLHHAGHRWWSVEELRATDDVVYPLDLAELLTDVLAGRVFDAPVVLPWHH